MGFPWWDLGGTMQVEHLLTEEVRGGRTTTK